MNTQLLLTYLDLRRHPVADEEHALTVHRSLCADAPRLYLALLADRSAHTSHLRLVLVTLLTHPVARERVGRDEITARLRALPGDRALAVLEALRLRRINCRRARQIGLAVLLGGADFARWAATCRRRMIRLLRHLLGERTFSAVGRAMTPPATEQTKRYLRRTALRFATDAGAAREALAFLAGVSTDLSHPDLARAAAARQALDQGAGLPRETLMGLRGTFFPDRPNSDVIKLSAVAPASARRDGPLTMALRSALLGELDPPHTQVLEQAELEAAAGLLGGLDAKLAVVLDLSASMVSSGERVQHPAALALALTRLLRRLFSSVSVFRVGGTGEELAGFPCPSPEGATDLASALLEAAREAPQMMVVLTDGYENVRQGDAAQVLRGLKLLERAPALMQAVTVFTPQEDISKRVLDGVPALPVAHELDVVELVVRVALTSEPDQLDLESPAVRLLEELLCAQSSPDMEVVR